MSANDRLERIDLQQRGIEVSAKADRAIVHEHVGGGLSIRHLVYEDARLGTSRGHARRVWR